MSLGVNKQKVDGWINLETRNVAFWISNSSTMLRLCVRFQNETRPFISLRDHLKDSGIMKTDGNISLWNKYVDTHSLDVALQNIK